MESDAGNMIVPTSESVGFNCLNDKIDGVEREPLVRSLMTGSGQPVELSTLRNRRGWDAFESNLPKESLDSPLINAFATDAPHYREIQSKQETASEAMKFESSDFLYTPPPIRRLFRSTEGKDCNQLESSASSIQVFKKSAATVLSKALNRYQRLPIRPKIPRIPFLPRLRHRIRYIRLAPQQAQQASVSGRKKRWLIPAEHPLKVIWDVMTFLLSFLNAYLTHVAIGDRSIGTLHAYQRFCQLWFFVDILLNFVTERNLSTSSSDGNDEEGRTVLTKCQAVWARYLTTWFVIDLLSLVPGEVLFVKPIIEQQKRLGFFKRQLFRIRAVGRFLAGGIVRRIRRKHFAMFSTVAKHSKRAGMGGTTFLLRKILKYVPKYVLFIRKMKALLALRVLRQVHWFQKLWHNLSTIVRRQRKGGIETFLTKQRSPTSFSNDIDDDTISTTCEDDFDCIHDRDLDNISCGDELNDLSDEVDEDIDNWSQNSRSRVLLVDASDAWEVLDDSSLAFSENVIDQNAIEEDDSDGGYPY